MNTYSRGAHDVTREPVTSPTEGGSRGGISPRLHTYHHHLQKPRAEPISFFWRYSWSPEILIVVILCQSVSQQLLCLHVEDLTRQKGNHAKSKPTPTNMKAGTHQKQTDESLNNQSKVVHEYLFIVETKNTPNANQSKQTDTHTKASITNLR